MKTRIILAAFAVLLSSSLRAQPEPTYDGNGKALWTKDNIWSKNMELVKSARVNTPSGTDATGVAEYFQMFEQTDNSGHVHVYLCDAQNEWVWIEDVTDPRNPFTAVLIKGSSWVYDANYVDPNGDHTKDTKRPSQIEFDRNVHWVDNHPSGSGALAGHTFAVVNCGDVPVAHDMTKTNLPITRSARFLIFDLTAALAHVAQYGSSTYNMIDIDDASGRSSAHLDAGPNSGVMTNSVYIGYIEKDNTTRFSDKDPNHLNPIPTCSSAEYIWCERTEGVMLIPGGQYESACTPAPQYESYLDLFLLGGNNASSENGNVATTGLYNDPNAQSPTAFVVPTRVMEYPWDCAHSCQVNGRADGCLDNNGQPLPAQPLEPIECYYYDAAHTPPLYNGANVPGIKEARGYIKPSTNGNTLIIYITRFGRNEQDREAFAQELEGPDIPAATCTDVNGKYPINPCGDCDANSPNWPEVGGCQTIEVDFSNPSNAIEKPVTGGSWDFHNDRSSPSSKLSTTHTDWTCYSNHSFDLLRFDANNLLFLTTNELASPSWSPTDSGYGNNGMNYQCPYSMDPVVTDRNCCLSPWPLFTVPSSSINYNTGDYYVHFRDAVNYKNTSNYGDPLHPEPSEDHRLFGNYLRIWYSNPDQETIAGTGTNNGPAGSYDPIQQSPADRLAGTHTPVLANTAIAGVTDGIAPTDCSIGNTSRAPYTIHRPKTFYGETNVVPSGPAATEVYMAGYSQGVRVIDLSNFITPGQVPANTTHPVIERAYFDWIPTLNYDINSDFFYALSSTSNIQRFFYGSYDCMPDVRATQTYSDENFVYTMGINDAQRSPLLQNGGFLILRYFRDQIGGHISGYARSTTDQNDNASSKDPVTETYPYETSYREVNLQGTFTVARQTIIDQGCTVHVLDGSTFNPSGTNNIEVDGTLSVETTSEDNRATFKVPIHVVSGGTLIMQSNSHSEFTQLITVDPGGTLEIKDGTKTVFSYGTVQCNGIFEVSGLSGQLAEIDGAVSTTDRTIVTGACSIKMLGRGNAANLSLCSIFYATFNNVSVNAMDITPNPLGTVGGSHFHYNLTTVWTEFRFERDALLPGTHPSYIVGVNGSSFDAVNGPPIEQDGVAINGPYIHARINSCTFDNLESAVYVDGATFAHISSNTVTNSVGAISLYFTTPLVCSNTCSDDMFCLDVFLCTNPVVYDNAFTRTAAAIMSDASGTTYYRANTFDTYCDGIVTYSGYAQMRAAANLVANPPYILLGRNQFTQASNYFGTYGCGAFDVWLDPVSNLDVHCGYNKFALYSVSQVFGNPAVTFDASTNNWQDPNCLTVRTNMLWSGTDLCNSQTLAPACYSLPSLDGCTSGGGGGGGGGGGTSTNYRVTDDGGAPTTSAFWAEADTTGDTLEADYNFRLVAMFDTTATLGTRRTSAIEAFEAARLIDSFQLYSQLLGTFNALAIDPTANNDLKATAIALRGMTFEVLGSIDSAIAMYNTICTGFASTNDSIPAAWRIQYLAAVADTVNVDSLLLVFQNRQFADIIRLIPIADTSGGGAYKIAKYQNAPLADTASLEMTVHPNPATNLARICVLDLPAGTPVTLIVVNEAGEIVSTLYNSTPDAELGLCCTLDCSKLPNGTYFARLWNDILGQSVKLLVQH
ncbi:MAG TPA: right-handed parallel beta-helix repeat-containing protein [Candidatus Kapabacteria bacterium]|nr:right-handed parallel beta-helix repeat-containing protein [Candidatus Kapabacteria bacterium]